MMVTVFSRNLELYFSQLSGVVLIFVSIGEIDILEKDGSVSHSWTGGGWPHSGTCCKSVFHHQADTWQLKARM